MATPWVCASFLCFSAEDHYTISRLVSLSCKGMLTNGKPVLLKTHLWSGKGPGPIKKEGPDPPSLLADLAPEPTCPQLADSPAKSALLSFSLPLSITTSSVQSLLGLHPTPPSSFPLLVAFLGYWHPDVSSGERILYGLTQPPPRPCATLSGSLHLDPDASLGSPCWPLMLSRALG